MEIKISMHVDKNIIHRARWLRGNATRIAFGRSRVQIPLPANLVEVFSGFLNLKIAKELVLFKDKCRVGHHIPLLLIQYYLMFTVSRDLETNVVKMVKF